MTLRYKEKTNTTIEQTHRYTDRQGTDTQIHRQASGQTHRYTDRQVDRHTDTQTDTRDTDTQTREQIHRQGSRFKDKGADI